MYEIMMSKRVSECTHISDELKFRLNNKNTSIDMTTKNGKTNHMAQEILDE